MKRTQLFIAIMMISMTVPLVSAGLMLDALQFDPAIISAGDEVDIVVQYRATLSGLDDKKIDDTNYRFKVFILPDDTLSQKYITIVDGDGDDLFGSIYSGETYNKKFRVKVSPQAPAGSYEFKLIGQWYLNDVAESAEQYVRFTMPVKKEGIILGISQLQTVPAEVRSGDDYVKVIARIENSGGKDAKSVEIKAITPDGISSSYTDDNRQYVGYVTAGESKEVTFYVDIDEYLAPGVADILYTMDFMDTDNNKYQSATTLPFRIKPRPYLEIVESYGTGVAGASTQLKVVVKNTGQESAEAVEVRIIKQSAQPFSMDVRSDYLGEIEPGANATALFDIDISREAQSKEYSLKLLLRSKGDSDQGDDTIYTYTRNADITVNGTRPNYLLYIGLGVLGLIIVVVGMRGLRR